MAHETFETADQSVLYFIEVPNDQLARNSSSLKNPHGQQYVLSGDPPQSKIVTFEDTDNVQTFVMPQCASDTLSSTETIHGIGNDYFHSDFNVVLPQEHLQEIVCATTDSIDIPRDSLPEELSFERNCNGRLAPHLLDHMYSMNISRSVCVCGSCGDTENTDHDEKDAVEPEHMEGDSANEKKTNYKCCYCDYKASRRQHVKQHVATHLVDKPYKCKMCDYSASQKQSLVAHALRFHYKRKPYKCEICDYSAFRKQHVVVHMGKHMKEKPYKCDDCDFQTSWKEYLSVHKRNLHPTSKTFKPWCE